MPRKIDPRKCEYSKKGEYSLMFAVHSHHGITCNGEGKRPENCPLRNGCIAFK